MRISKFLFNQLEKCSACGLCETVCPAMASEKDSGPRVRAQMALQDKIVPCLNCGRCAKVCPAGLPLDVIFMLLSARTTRKNSFLPKLLCSDNAIFDKIQSPLAKAQKIFNEYAPRLTGPQLGVEPVKPPKKPQGKILYFTGCLERRFIPEIINQALELLNRAGQNAELVKTSCCGRLFLQGGHYRQALKTIRRNIKILSALKPEQLIFSCPACAHSVRSIWPHLPFLSEEERASAQKISESVIDIYECLAQGLKAKEQDFDACVWHKPCLMTDKAQDTFFSLFSSPLPQNLPDSCCGASCSNIKDYFNKITRTHTETSLRGLTAWRHLRDEFMASRKHSIISSCPACYITIRNQLDKSRLVQHGINILYQSQMKDS